MPTPEQELILNGLKKTVLPLLSKKNDGQHIINGKYIFTQGLYFFMLSINCCAYGIVSVTIIEESSDNSRLNPCKMT